MNISRMLLALAGVCFAAVLWVMTHGPLEDRFLFQMLLSVGIIAGGLGLMTDSNRYTFSTIGGAIVTLSGVGALLLTVFGK